VPKAFVEVAGRTLLEHAVAQLHDVGRLVVVVPETLVDAAASSLTEAVVVPGGATRQGSVRCGLAEIGPEFEVVLVHDAARAFTPRAVFERVVAAVRAGADAAIPTLPLSDTVKRVDASGVVVETVDRETLVAVQTPQGFRREVLIHAHEGAAETAATDDAALVEQQGGRVQTVPGAREAFKITTPDDLARAELLLAAWS